jgi:hypothetical protein
VAAVGGSLRAGVACGKSGALWAAAAVDLSDLVCSKCHAAARKQRGCHGGARRHDGRPLWFAGEAGESDTCPRRLVLSEPGIADAFALARAVGDRLGAEGQRIVSGRAADALAVIDDARAYRMESETKAAAAKAAAAKGGGSGK